MSTATAAHPSSYAQDPLYFACARLSIFGIHTHIKSVAGLDGAFLLHGRPIQRVEVCGIVVDKRQWDNRCEYVVDDGTGILPVNQWPPNERDAAMSNQFGIFQPGQPVTFHGKLSWYKESMRLILMGGRVEIDADIDALSWLDIIVHDKDYRKPPSMAPQPCPRALAALNSSNRFLFASSAAPPVRTTAPVVTKFTAAAPTSTALAFMKPRVQSEPGEPLPATRNEDYEMPDSATFVDEACVFGTSFEPLVAAGQVSGSSLTQFVPAFALKCVELLLQQDLPPFNSPNGFATSDFTTHLQLHRETLGLFATQHVPFSQLSQGVMCTGWLARCLEHLKSHGRVMAVVGDAGQTRWRFIDLRADVEPKLLEFLRTRDCANVAELESVFVTWFPQLSRGLLHDALKSLEAQSLIFEADTDCFRVVSE